MFTSEEDFRRAGEGVLACTLPKREWTHQAHFAVALWLMRHRADIDLPRAMPAIIRAYNEATGVTNNDSGGYHETITQASLRAARAQMARQGDAPLPAVLAGLMASPLGQSGWLLEFWSKDLLMSVTARREWCEPDLKALPY